MTNAYAKQSVDSAPAAYLYGSTPANSALGHWIEDLRRARLSNCPSDLDMAGRGVIIINDDEEDALLSLSHAADSAGYALHQFDKEFVEELTTTAANDSSVSANEATLIWIPRHYWSEVGSEEAVHQSNEGVHWVDAGLRPGHLSIAQLMNTSRPGRVVVVVTVLQGLTPLPEALRRAGRFDRRISLPKFSEAAVGAAFLHEIGMRSIDPSLAASPERVGFVLREEFKDARRRSLLRTALQRRSWRTQRKIMFSDLIEFAVHGTGEEDTRNIPADELFRTALHEAGHVVVSWLDSHEGRAPVYASVTDRSGSLGVVVPPYNAYERISHDNTRRDIDHRIRVCLAGRVAENMMIGRDLVSAAGSARDLECASALAYRMFSDWGLPVSDEDSDNLAVFGENVSEAERARVSRLVRGYLSDQFKVVEGLLRCNLTLLRRIARELAEKGVLFQEDIERLNSHARICA